MKKWLTVCLVAICALAALSGCMQADRVEDPSPAALGDADAPALPEKLQMKDSTPYITVYNTQTEKTEEMDVEQYVCGVLAGEMRSDWPMEALKAQAILARTFVLKFISEKESKYPGADISTDISEAQAYSAQKIDSRVEQAVNATRGQVLVTEGGEFPYAWFHAHSGGTTELPTKALDYDKDDPAYVQSVSSPESDKAPDSVKAWRAEFSGEEVAKAARDTGAKISSVESIELGEKGESGRTVYFLINGEKVSAPALRVQLDSQRLKSTLISSVSFKDGKVVFEGKGYGHGVGMSQWGAYGMAEEGKSAREIIAHYFRNVKLAQAW